MQVSAIIAAAGSGQRLGGDIPKQFRLLGGKPVLARTLEAFDNHACINDMYVVVPIDYVSHTQELVLQYGYKKMCKVLAGGANRALSVYAALKQLPSTDIVLIHDGARPFVSGELIKAVAEAAATHGAAVAGTPLTDTLKQTDSTGSVVATPDRSQYWQVQTPQGFTYEIITKAYAHGENTKTLDHVTDDSMLVEQMGKAVQMVNGHPSNIKITNREDIIYSEAVLQSGI